MKNNRIIPLILAFAATVFFFSCNDNDEGIEPVSVTTVSVKNVRYTTADLTGESEGKVSETGFVWSLSKEPTISDNVIKAGATQDGFEASLSGLTTGTTYYVRAYARTGSGEVVYGGQQHFTTYEEGEPILFLETIRTSSFNAQVDVKVLADGGRQIGTVGVCYSLVENPTVIEADEVMTVRYEGKKIYRFDLEDLEDLRTYYLRAFVEYPDGSVHYEENTELEIETPISPPQFVFDPIVDIKDNSFVVSGSVSTQSRFEIEEFGIAYGTGNDPESASTIPSDSFTTETEIDGLTKGTRYYVWLYARTTNGTITYSELQNARTFSREPAVLTGTIGDIYKYKVMMTGNVIDYLGEDGEPLTSAGVCFSATNPLPEVTDAIITQSNLEIGDMEDLVIQRLIPNTTYYIRAYGENQHGISYGEVVEFTTREETQVIYPDASTSTGLYSAPNFTMTRAFYNSANSSSSGTRNKSPWQEELLNKLYDRMVDLGAELPFIQMSFLDTKEQTHKVVGVRYQFNTGTSSSDGGYIFFKFRIDDEGLWNFYEPTLSENITDNASYRDAMEKYKEFKADAIMGPLMEEFEQYLEGNKFMMEFYNTTTTFEYMLIPIEDESKYFKANGLRTSGTFNTRWVNEW